MQSSREQQGEIRKPSSAINAKKWRKPIEWERLEISSRKLEISKEHFNPKMGTIMDRNGKDLIEAGEIKKIWREYTEELYRKDLNDLVKHDDVVTHPEPDILECEFKWALGSTAASKASGDDGIPAELFKILKDDAGKVLHSIYQQIWKTQQWPQDWKRSIFTPVPNTGSTKECINSWNNCAHFPL